MSKSLLLMLLLSSAAVATASDVITGAAPALPDCFLSIGDWGGSNWHVQAVALFMDNITANPQLFDCNSVSFIISLGDNFYNFGVTNTTDPQWNSTYRDQFRNKTRTPSLAELPMYVVVGNHDYGTDTVTVTPQFVGAQIAYSAIDPLWIFPDANYTIDKNLSGINIRFVMMNTEPMHLCADGRDICFQQDQAQWVNATFANADYDPSVDLLVAVGHHNVYSPLGGHIDPQYDALLGPILENHRVSFALFGHSHFACWGKSPHVVNEGDPRSNNNSFPGSLWFLTNGAARGSDPDNCSFQEDTPLQETFCAPDIENQEGAFMLHRVIPSASGDMKNLSDHKVEHCFYGAESGIKVACVMTHFRSFLSPTNVPTDGNDDAWWKEQKWIFVMGGSAGGVVLLVVTAFGVRFFRSRKFGIRRRVGHDEQIYLWESAVM